MFEVLIALGTVSGFALGLFVGIRYPVRVKLVADKIDDIDKDALKHFVDQGVERLKKIKGERG